MRIATLIISLIVTLFLTLQSLAVMAAGSLVSGFSDTAAEKSEGENMSASGAMGLVAAILWTVGAGFVLMKPKVSKWIFIVATPNCVLGAAAGFSDLWFYTAVSVVFALMSHFGIKEKARKDEQERAAYQADIVAAARAIASTTSSS